MTEAKVALVTGAGSGIGKAVALKLAASGFRVVLCGRRAELLEAVRREAGDGHVAIATDVTDPSAVDALFASIEKDCGRLDLLFNNAGVSGKPGPVEDVALDDFQRVLQTNVTGAFLCAQAAYRLMRRQQPQGGRIVNNGSVSAQVPRPHLAAYTVSKHALTGLTKQLALEGRKYGIGCGQIDIGNTRTELLAGIGREALQADGSMRAEASFDVKHVADAVLYMALLPLEANVLSMTVAATAMPLVGRG